MNKKKRREFLEKSIALTLVLGTGTMLTVAQAEEEIMSYNLDTVVVTATRTEESIKDVPASVTVITAEDMAKMNVQTVDQALRVAAGVFVNRGKGLTATTAAVSLRGFSGQGQTLVLLDGQPLNHAYAGSVNWSSIPMQSIERIEVVKGSNSALYGSQAMGGVINIITKNPQAQEIRLAAKYESYNTWTEQLDVSDKINDKFSYRLGYERKTSDGYVTDLVTKTTSPAGYSGWIPTTNSKGTQNLYIVGDKGKNSWDQDMLDGKLIYKIDDNRSITFGYQHDKYEYSYRQGHNYLVNSSGDTYGGYASNTFLGLPGGRETNVYTLGYKDKGSGVTVNAGLTDVVSNWYISSIAGTATSAGGTGVMSETPNRRWNLDVQKEINLSEKDKLVAGANYRNDWIHNREINLPDWTDIGRKGSVN
ncbi:MAG: TonB-dependent receptor plug domain-containing protein, partial [Bacillota bacterium]